MAYKGQHEGKIITTRNLRRLIYHLAVADYLADSGTPTGI